MEILRLDPGHERWADYVAHLRRVDMAQWVLDDDGAPAASTLLLGARVGDEMVGDLALRVQPVLMPATEWSGGVDRPVLDASGEPVRETFVMTFAVDEAHRRRGIGRALQVAALAWTREVGCVQMRSWSSLDKPHNYALKLSLGFAMAPAVHDGAGGYAVSGVYFVRRVDTDASAIV